MRLAIFDLDNTLLAGDSDYAWGQFLVSKGLVDGDSYRKANDQFYEDYKAGTLDIHKYLKFSLAPLTEHSMEFLTDLHQEFMQTMIEPIMLPKAQELLQEHRAKGDYLLIITATNGFVTRPIGKRLGVDDLLATDPEIKNGKFSGSFVGTPCFQHGKVICLNEWIKTHRFNLNDAFFYSDSINDLPLLELVPNPIAVDPDDRLRKVAQEKKWQILSLRD